MRRSDIVAAGVVAVLGQSVAVLAEGAAPIAIPAEFPPASYTANQYVDSTGCVFVRAVLAGTVDWVPRVTRQREQLCGFTPSLAPGQGLAYNPQTTSLEGVTIIGAPVAAPAAVDAPIQTVASLMASQPVTAPIAQPLPAIAEATPIVTAPEPRRITMAEACEGKFGIQPGLVNAETRAPIDCGPAPMIATQTAPIIVPEVGEVLTAAAICASISETGQRYITNTGEEVRCGPQTQPIASYGAPVYGTTTTIATIAPVAAPVTVPLAGSVAAETIAAASGVPLSTAAPIVINPIIVPAMAMGELTSCPALDPLSAQYMLGDDVRCGPQSQSPSGTTGAIRVMTDSVATSTAPARVENGLFGATVPASNAYGPIADIPLPAGYEPAWSDDRLNPYRGLPSYAVSATVVATPAATSVSTRSVAPVAAAVAPVADTSHRFVQVGTFAQPANADATIARLQAMGLPVSQGTVRRNGQVLQVIAAGPFASAEALRAALQAAKAAGYADAFTRG